MAAGRSSSSAASQGPGAHPEPVQRLVEAFAQLPGIGRRTAERLAFHVLKSPKAEAQRRIRRISDSLETELRAQESLF